MVVKFWGVRGTFPTPGPSTVRIGGNTSCVSVDLGEDQTLVLDAGTGIRKLGLELVERDTQLFLLTTHVHWDHIQGIPLFRPLYQAERVIYILPGLGSDLVRSLLRQMDGLHFPVRSEELQSKTVFLEGDCSPFLAAHGFEMERIALNHPGGAFGYRIENAGRSVVYLTDNELFPPGEKATEFEQFVQFCASADLLIHDAQYLPEDMPAKLGWGHSLVSQVLDLAIAARVKHIVLFHHDPDRDDDAIDRIVADAQRRLQAEAPELRCTAAYEGLTIAL